MKEIAEDVRMQREGTYFQIPMIVVWGARSMYQSGSYVGWIGFMQSAVSLIGLLIMGVILIRIYILNQGKYLLTSDVFALTRHPMYHGMFIADASSFLVADLASPLFWASWVLFLSLLVMAGWYQEKETLARWGGEAERYYARTPRFIFEWLFR